MKHIVINKLLKKFGISESERIEPDGALLNKLAPLSNNFYFVSQAELPEDEYYESFIHRTSKIPTREGSWHDFFNGLIWHQFPKTKRLLNQLHVQYIEKHGLKPRGPVRDRLTHFDECGLVLFWRGSDPKPLLEQHKWQTLFCDRRKNWFDCWQPVIFGHALYEMLQSPYLGITAKVICINCEEVTKMESAKVQDLLLKQYIEETKLFEKKRSMLPLPLLGIPGWHFAEQNASFYRDTSYFMPKRSASKANRPLAAKDD